MNAPRLTSPLASLGAFGLAALVLLPSATVAEDPLGAPIGTLKVGHQHVRTGKKVRVSWDITYPLGIADIIRIDPRGRFTTTQNLNFTVHAIGGEYSTRSHDNGHGNNEDGVDVTNPGRGHGGPNGTPDSSEPIDDETSENGNFRETPLELDATIWIWEGNNWNELYQGRPTGLVGDPIYQQDALPMNTTVNLAARGDSDRGPSQLVSTISEGPGLMVLTDGDPLPSNVSAFQNGQISDFLSAYVEDGIVQLGPLQVLYLFDLDGHPGSGRYNMQDLGLLVSFETNDPVTIPR